MVPQNSSFNVVGRNVEVLKPHLAHDLLGVSGLQIGQHEHHHVRLTKKREGYMSMLYGDSPGRWKITRAQDGRSEASWTPTPDMANPFGNVHGGVIATVIDEVTGAAVMTAIETPSAPTVSMNIEYLYGIAIGETYAAVGEIVRMGRAMAIVDARIMNDDGKVFARGTCIFQIPRPK